MTEQEREFKVKMIQKYQEDLNKEGTQITQINSLGVLGGVLCLASGIAYLLEYRFIDAAILLLFGSFSITVQIKNLISTIAKKAGIEQEIERLKEDIAVDIINESVMDNQKDEKVKEYKINKIEKYNNEISKQKSGWSSLAIFLGAVVIVLGISNMLNNDIISYLIGATKIFIGAGIETVYVEKVIEKLAKKAGLETEVQRLHNELEITNNINSENYVNEEERGHSR